MDYPETLYDEFMIIQKNDPYFENKEIRFDDEFYTEDYEQFLEEEGRETGIISEEELEEEEEEEREPESLDDIMIRIVENLDIYQEIYKVPPARISDRAWEQFFENVFRYYDQQQLTYFCYEDMATMNRLAIARSLLYEKQFLEIGDYKESIRYLNSRVLSPSMIEELVEMNKQEEQTKKTTVIQIGKYLEKRKVRNLQ